MNVHNLSDEYVRQLHRHDFSLCLNSEATLSGLSQLINKTDCIRPSLNSKRTVSSKSKFWLGGNAVLQRWHYGQWADNLEAPLSPLDTADFQAIEYTNGATIKQLHQLDFQNTGCLKIVPYHTFNELSMPEHNNRFCWRAFFINLISTLFAHHLVTLYNGIRPSCSFSMNWPAAINNSLGCQSFHFPAWIESRRALLPLEKSRFASFLQFAQKSKSHYRYATAPAIMLPDSGSKSVHAGIQYSAAHCFFLLYPFLAAAPPAAFLYCHVSFTCFVFKVMQVVIFRDQCSGFSVQAADFKILASCNNPFFSERSVITIIIIGTDTDHVP